MDYVSILQYNKIMTFTDTVYNLIC
jgi:hypothetical protein